MVIMDNQHQLVDERRIVKLNQVTNAFPDLPEDVCIDILEAVYWNAEDAILMLRENPTSYSSYSIDWPSLLEPKEETSMKRHGSGSSSKRLNSHSSEDEKLESVPLRMSTTLNEFDQNSLNPGNTGVPEFRKLPEGVNPYFLRTVLDAELSTPNKQLLEDVFKGTENLLILMRGLPGSGKSTLAKVFMSLTDDGLSVSADDYFKDSKGNYKFICSELPNAHTSAQRKCREALDNGCNPIVIDNTNTMGWEMLPYVKLALEYGYKVCLSEPQTPWKKDIRTLAVKNTHNVPKEKIRAMMGRFEVISVENLLQSVDIHRPAESGLNDRKQRSISDPFNLVKKKQVFPKKKSKERNETRPIEQEQKSKEPSEDPAMSDFCFRDKEVFYCQAEKPSNEIPTEENSFVLTNKERKSDKIKSDTDNLHGLFPKINRDHLDDMFEKCNYNLDWCVEILLDSNYEMFCEGMSNLDVLDTRDTREILQLDTEGDKEDSPLQSPSSSIEEKSRNSDSPESGQGEIVLEPIDGPDWIDIDLSKRFLTNLAKLYPSPFEERVKEGLGIRIPPILAFELYKYILLNEYYTQPFELTESSEEMVTKGTMKGSKTLKKTFASLLKMGKLQATFPRLSPEEIRKVFNKSDFDEALQTLKVSFPGHFYPPGLNEAIYCQPRIKPRKDDSINLPCTARNNNDTLEEVRGAEGGLQEEERNPKTYLEWRDIAIHHHQMRVYYREKINEIPKHSAGGIADHYRDMAQTHTDCMRDANKIAAEMILSEVRNGKDKELDLHYLYTQEALQVLQQFIQGWKERLRVSGKDSVNVRIITGKGKNSYNGTPRLRPTVLQHLQSLNYAHYEMEGLIIVTITAPKRDLKN